MSTTAVLATIGGLIIVGLASYAAHLLLKLKKQTELQQQQQALAIAKRNANIFESVDTICLAGIQGQCDLSEATIRIYCILDYVQGEERIDFAATYPAMQELYDVVKDMPRSEARKELGKKERMKFDYDRMKAEAKLHDAIKQELEVLQNQIKPLNTTIPIKMI
ncbi:DUF2489 domain-containing protein [Vibrio sp. Of7-15]|uniref:DUF2489 domain-containing protein n=1 Tax=Vibrio sp. Of7-15 TaxID=2724879 RepID=UPI001EF25C95|nr:DUF2489 domain-containing protein [Vibrio sp. Of7-15]MCG7496754.1 DUF2489 domain-containing protein [Vibrio sp. Of7-15]